MNRVLKTTFTASRDNLDRLFGCNRISAEVWNRCLELAKEHHKDTGHWINRTFLQTLTKRQFPLHSQSVQSVCHRYIWNRDAAHQARKAGYDTRYPYKTKKYFPTRWVQEGFTIYPNGRIELSMGNWQGKRQKPIVLYAHKLPLQEVKMIELLWDGKLKLGLTFKSGIQAELKTTGQEAAIDLGEIHGIAAVTESGEAMVSTSRKLRSIKRLRNKKYKELGKKRSRCTKGSRQWRKLTRAMQRLKTKTDNQQRDILHKQSRQFVDWAEEHDVRIVYVGDVEGVQRNTSARKKSNPKHERRSRKHNQRMSQWPFGLLVGYLTYKLKEKGVLLETIDESYTTQTCPVCTRRKKPSGRMYRCKCGYALHRDVHGARNILSKAKYGKITTGDITMPKRVMYLRPAA